VSMGQGPCRGLHDKADREAEKQSISEAMGSTGVRSITVGNKSTVSIQSIFGTELISGP
jgi:hypothetical protein